MILGLCALVVGNIFIWQSGEETTQFFSGWVLGVVALFMSPAAPKMPRVVLTLVACVFIVLNEQKLITETDMIDCVHGSPRVIGGVNTCVCTPPYEGIACAECPDGAINEGNTTHPICYTCRHQYVFPHCKELLPGYANETECYDRWQPSCLNVNFKFAEQFKTYETMEGDRDRLYDYSEDDCLGIQGNPGKVYCDKCKPNHSGPDCCPDGKYGQDCSEDVPKCNGDLDYNAVLKPNAFPTEYGLVDPRICYNSSCTCGGEFIGDSMCVSNFCVDGKCADVARTPEYRFRCQCDVGVGPDCVTPPCYGGTRMWNGKGVCKCNAQHTDAHSGATFDSCEKQTDGQCFPGLFGDMCRECQCAVDIKDALHTRQCPKTHYGVFERDFRTKEFVEDDTKKCINSGICTSEPDDCGSEERCLLFTNPGSFTAILFSGDNCTDTRDSKCAVFENCRPM